MPWKETTNMSQRTEFIAQAKGEGVNFSALCRLYGISRKTGYKWLASGRGCNLRCLCTAHIIDANMETARTALAVRIAVRGERRVIWKCKYWKCARNIRLGADGRFAEFFKIRGKHRYPLRAPSRQSCTGMSRLIWLKPKSTSRWCGLCVSIRTSYGRWISRVIFP